MIACGVVQERLTLVEANPVFAAALRARFSRVNLVESDGFRFQDIADGMGFAAIVSSLPLLNFPIEKRHTLAAGALARLVPGAPFVQFSYGWHAPLEAPDGATIMLAARLA